MDKIGDVGKLNEEIEQEWIFWSVFQKFPQLMIIENELSLKKLNKIYAIIQMNNDFEKAKLQYDLKIMEIKRRNMRGM